MVDSCKQGQYTGFKEFVNPEHRIIYVSFMILLQSSSMRFGTNKLKTIIPHKVYEGRSLSISPHRYASLGWFRFLAPYFYADRSPA